MTSAKGIFIKFHKRLHGDQRGFTIIEAMIAITILTIGAFAVAQSLTFGLKATGISRLRLGAEALTQKQQEKVRSLAYENIALSNIQSGPGADPILHSTDPENPNYWVDSSAIDDPTYAPDEDVDLGYEEVVLNGQIPNLTNEVNAGSTYSVYQYVTWVDIAADGVGVDDDANGDGNDETDDAGGHDAKRLTIVVTWEDNYRAGNVVTYKSSTLISQGSLAIGNAEALPNQTPTVDCPTASSLVSPVGFTANADDTDGSIASIDWNFGDATVAMNAGATQTHTYTASGTYTVTVTVTDDEGATAVTSGCDYTVTVPVNTNEVQTITLGNGVTGGTFTITFDGQTTAAIAWNAPATGTGSVQKALKQLSNVSSGDISVSGPTGGPYVLTFGGAYVYTDVPQVTVTDSLTPTAATVVATTVTAGVGTGGGGATARPSGTVTINGGAAYTTTQLVSLALSATPGTTGSAVTNMRFSLTGNEEDYGSAVAYGTSTSYSLAATQGAQSIYVQFQDAAGRWSEDATDSITLDSVAPSAFTLNKPTRGPTTGASANRYKTVTLTWTTAGTGVTYYPEYKSTASSTWITTVPNCGATTLLTLTTCLGPAYPLAQWNFRIKAVDAAGNQTYSTPCGTCGSIVTVHSSATVSGP